MNKQVAVVTGASQGIGYGIASYLAGKGYQLLLLARNQSRLENCVDEMLAQFPGLKRPSIASVDVADYEKVKMAITQFAEKEGRIDLLCNSAGYVKRGTSELAPNELIKMVNTNLIGAFNCIHVIAPYMKKQMNGRIINIASRSGKVARKQLGGYAASKFGLMGLNEALYKELAHFGIYVTAICPNLVATEMTADVDMKKTDMIQVEDIVKTVDYLLQVSPAVAISDILMHCRARLLEE